MTPAKPKSKSAPNSKSGLTVAFVVLAAVAAGYLLWRKPAEPVAPIVAARPAPVARPAPEPVPVAPVMPEPPAFDAAGFGDPAQMQEMQTQMLDFAYGDLLGQLNLAPQQAEQLKGLLADRMTAFQSAMMEMFTAGGANGFDPAAFQQIGDRVEAQFADRIKGVVGASNAQQIQAYDTELRETFQNGGGGFPGSN